MKKTFFLFLLLLISISSINGAVISIPETVTETGYYVELNDRTLSTELVKMQLGGIDWGHSAPVVTGVDGNRIYFQTKNDLARFCSIISYNSQTMAFSGQFVPYIDGLAVPLTVISTHGTFNPNYRDIGGYLNTNTKTSQIAYVYAHSSNNDFSQTWIENNGVEIYTCGYSSSNPQFIPITLMSNNQITLSYRGGGYSSRSSRMATSLVVFDYVDWEYEAVRVVGTNQELYTPPERGTISIYTEPSVSVYSGNSLLGTTDNGGHLELSLPLGEHTLKFVKTGYYNVTQTVVIDSSVNLTVNMETTHISVPLSITNSEGGLTGVNLYIDGNIEGTVSNNQDISLPKGTHEIKFQKSGYWNETRIITINEELERISIRMYPESVFFKLSYTPSVIETYKNSEIPVSLKISPNAKSYGVKLYITGKDVLNVRDSNNEQISKVDSYYSLSDISNEKIINLKINSGEKLGNNDIQVRVTGYNELGTEFVTDTLISYDILRLPIAVTVPKWSIGSNSIVVIETEGVTRTVVLKIVDEQNNIIYSDSYTFEGFETQKFDVVFDETGKYRLYIQSGDLINTYIDVEVTNPVELLTESITVNKGGTGTVKLKITNPFVQPQYYRIEIIGDSLKDNVRFDFSISPKTTREIPVSVPINNSLDFDSYSGTVKVYIIENNGLTEIYSDFIVMNIGSGSGGFIPVIDDGLIDTVVSIVIDNKYVVIGLGALTGGLLVFRGKSRKRKGVRK